MPADTPGQNSVFDRVKLYWGKGGAVRGKNGLIDESKCASTFKNFKKQLNVEINNNPEKEVTATTPPKI